MFANDDSRPTSSFGKQLALIAVALLLTACATQKSMQLPDMSDWAARTAVLGGVTDWQFSGRIAVSAGEEGFNGKIRWHQQGDTFKATVSGPLGIGTVRIEGDGELVIHTDKDGVRTEMKNAEQDLLYRYGWTIPVKSLRFWALGLPDPSIPAQTELNPEQQLAKLEQQDWTVIISRYRSSRGQSMPRLMSATGSETRVRMVFDKWSFFD
ncbi:MAG: lipoprotein insertase outer membrane protein LolB [Woeseiaceae bacterium]